jgi:ComF family protein
LVAQGVFAAIFPSDCRFCGAPPLLNISRLPVCLDCLVAIRPISGETCDLCGEGLPSLVGLQDSRSCEVCRDARPHFAKAVAYGAYDEKLRDLIHLLKYDQVLSSAVVLGEKLALAIQKLDMSGPTLVIPVALHSAKRRQRGFNQAELIAAAVLKRLARGDMKLDFKILVRVRPTASQIGLTRPQRRENIRGAFQVVHPNKVSGRSILLADDVLTTGTTASECARVLRKAGAERAWVATVARTLKINTGGFAREQQFQARAS